MCSEKVLVEMIPFPPKCQTKQWNPFRPTKHDLDVIKGKEKIIIWDLREYMRELWILD